MARSKIIRGQRIDPAKLERAKKLRREMTPAEKRLWSALRGNRVDGLHFRRQQIIHGFIADFYCHTAGVVVELDGPVHRAQSDYDAERDAILAAEGLRVLRFANQEVLDNLKVVLRQIRSACEGALRT